MTSARDYVERPKKPEINMVKLVRRIGIGILVLIVLCTFFGCFYTVPAGSRAVLMTWSKPNMEEKLPGLHFKLKRFNRKVVLHMYS